MRKSIDYITTPIPEENKKKAILHVIGPIIAAGGAMIGTGDRGPAAVVTMNEPKIDEMTFFSKSALFLQKSSKKNQSTTHLRKKQLYNF